MGNSDSQLDILIRILEDAQGGKVTEAQVERIKEGLGGLGEEGEHQLGKISAGMRGAGVEMRDMAMLTNGVERAMSTGLDPRHAILLLRELGRVNDGIGSIIGSLTGPQLLALTAVATAAGLVWRKYSESGKTELEEFNKALEAHKKNIEEIQKSFHASLVEFRGAELEEGKRKALETPGKERASTAEEADKQLAKLKGMEAFGNGAEWSEENIRNVRAVSNAFNAEYEKWEDLQVKKLAAQKQYAAIEAQENRKIDAQNLDERLHKQLEGIDAQTAQSKANYKKQAADGKITDPGAKQASFQVEVQAAQTKQQAINSAIAELKQLGYAEESKAVKKLLEEREKLERKAALEQTEFETSQAEERRKNAEAQAANTSRLESQQARADAAERNRQTKAALDLQLRQERDKETTGPNAFNPVNYSKLLHQQAEAASNGDAIVLADLLQKADEEYGKELIRRATEKNAAAVKAQRARTPADQASLANQILYPPPPVATHPVEVPLTTAEALARQKQGGSAGQRAVKTIQVPDDNQPTIAATPPLPSQQPPTQVASTKSTTPQEISRGDEIPAPPPALTFDPLQAVLGEFITANMQAHQQNATGIKRLELQLATATKNLQGNLATLKDS